MYSAGSGRCQNVGATGGLSPHPQAFFSGPQQRALLMVCLHSVGPTTKAATQVSRHVCTS